MKCASIPWCILLLVLSMQQGSAQQLHFRATGYDVTVRITYQYPREAVMQLYLDSNGLAQCPAVLYRADDRTRELPLFRGQWKNGQLADTAWWYFENGALMRRAVFAAGTATALPLAWQEYRDAGLKGVLKGESVTWKLKPGTDSTFISQVENYSNGKLSGSVFTYETEGVLQKQETYLNGLRNGNSISYYPGGIISEEGAYENDLREGRWNSYSSEGVLIATDNYRKGMFHDTMIKYHLNGKIRCRMHFVNGETDGEYALFDTLGRISYYSHLSRFRERDSVEIYYYPSGKAKSIRPMRSDKPQGRFNAWHENGKLAETGLYEDGLKAGTWIYYNEEGHKTGERNFDLNPEPPEPQIHVFEERFSLIPKEEIGKWETTKLPEFREFSYPVTPPESAGLGFLTKYRFFDLDVIGEDYKRVQYVIRSPMPARQQKLLLEWLQIHFLKPHSVTINGRSHNTTVHFRVYITK